MSAVPVQMFPAADIFSKVNAETNVLIGGSQGSGKSVFEDGMICNLVTQYAPDEVDIYLIDPKRVQLRKWKFLPHVQAHANDVETARLTLDVVKKRMRDRYKNMERRGLEKYHGKPIYVFIDELADLMLEDRRGITERLQKILQLGRAANIHIVACSQAVNRVTVPTALQINFTCRVGLHCESAITSRMIVLQKGCEDLPRVGHCILVTPDGVESEKVPMYSRKKIDEIINYWG